MLSSSKLYNRGIVTDLYALCCNYVHLKFGQSYWLDKQAHGH